MNVIFEKIKYRLKKAMGKIDLHPEDCCEQLWRKCRECPYYIWEQTETKRLHEGEIPRKTFKF